MNKYLYLISHPAHYHMFKFSIQQLRENGHDVIVVIRPKDVLEQLCINDGIDYIRIKSRPKKYGIVGLALALINKDFELLRIVKKVRPNLLLGSDGSLARVGFVLNIPSFEFSEDDAKAIKLYAFTSYTFFTQIISPKVVDAWLWRKKKIAYDGYQKLAYLHPNQFTPNYDIKSKYVKEDTYFILRFSALNAYHDIGIKGFDSNLILEIISVLSGFGRVYISSENELSENLMPYALKINPLDIHHVLAFSSMLVGDSQSMSVESSLLGVPSIRYSSFVGKLSVLEELEHVYGLTFGFLPGEDRKMIEKINELMLIKDIKKVFNDRKLKMLAQKIDVTEFYVSYIENYLKK